MEAASFAANAYHAQLRLLDRMIEENDGPFVAGLQVTIADCITMASCNLRAGSMACRFRQTVAPYQNGTPAFRHAQARRAHPTHKRWWR